MGDYKSRVQSNRLWNFRRLIRLCDGTNAATKKIKQQPALHLAGIECGVFIGCQPDGKVIVRGFGDIPDENLPALTNAMRLLAARLTSDQRKRLVISLLH